MRRTAVPMALLAAVLLAGCVPARLPAPARPPKAEAPALSEAAVRAYAARLAAADNSAGMEETAGDFPLFDAEELVTLVDSRPLVEGYLDAMGDAAAVAAAETPGLYAGWSGEVRSTRDTWDRWAAGRDGTGIARMVYTTPGRGRGDVPDDVYDAAFDAHSLVLDLELLDPAAAGEFDTSFELLPGNRVRLTNGLSGGSGYPLTYSFARDAAGNWRVTGIEREGLAAFLRYFLVQTDEGC